MKIYFANWPEPKDKAAHPALANKDAKKQLYSYAYVVQYPDRKYLNENIPGR